MVYASFKVRALFPLLPSFPIHYILTPKLSDKLTLWFLPREWQDTISARGSVFLTGIVLFEAISLFTPFRVAALDHWAHLGGYLTGAAWASYWKTKRDRERKKRREELGVLGRLFSD